MTGPSELELRLADDLRTAHRRVAALELDADVKQRAHQRLLALSDAAKHDTAHAAARLDRFLHDLDAGRVSASDDAEGTV